MLVQTITERSTKQKHETMFAEKLEAMKSRKKEKRRKKNVGS